MIAPVRPRLWQMPILIGLVLLASRQAASGEDAVDARLRRDVTFLASDQCEGRGASTKGINLAADYIAAEFRKAGLKSPLPDGSYFQPFAMASGKAELGTSNTLSFKGPQGQQINVALDEDFRPLGLSGSGKVSAPIAFVGYGVTTANVPYDDFAGIDVAGKVVIIIRRAPRAGEATPAKPRQPFDGGYEEYHSALVTKLVNANLHKAAAVLFVSDRQQAAEQDELMPFARTAEGAGSAKLPAAHVHRAVIDKILAQAMDTNLSRIEEGIDRALKPHSALLPGWSVDLDFDVQHPTVPAKNVVGVAEGRGPQANETIVIGAHYDHLGYGDRGSLAKTHEPAIHHGADDNASGDTVLMELARRFGSRPGRPGRRLVFIAFSGEEAGLLGSEYYCKNPLFSLENTVAMVNMDMVGRLRPDKQTNKNKLIVYGTGTSPSFGGLLDGLNAKYDFKLQKVPGASMASERSSSDHASFYAKKIPVLFLFTGNHPDYHRPSDTSEKINVAGMHRVVDFTEEIVNQLAESPQRPQYVSVAVASPGRVSMPAGGRMPRLGIRPSYGDEGEGILLDGVSDGGPAMKAGLKEGDRLIELGGQPVKDLDTYMVLMARQKRGQTIQVVVLRDSKRVTLTVTPE